jgi:hypothetical protein
LAPRGFQLAAGSADGKASTLENAASFALAATAPHAVLDPLLERIFEAVGDDRAPGADLSSAVHTDTITWEEHVRRVVAAVAGAHPCGGVISVDRNRPAGVLVCVHSGLLVRRDFVATGLCARSSRFGLVATHLSSIDARDQRVVPRFFKMSITGLVAWVITAAENTWSSNIVRHP